MARPLTAGTAAWGYRDSVATMTGRTTILTALLCALIAAACGGDDATSLATPSPTDAQAVTASATEAPTEALTEAPTGPTGTPTSQPGVGQLGEPAPPTADDYKSEVPVPVGAGDPGPEPADGGATAGEITDLSGVALPLEPAEGAFDEGSILIQEDFQSTTPAILPVENEAGSGGYGNFDDLRFYEMVITDVDAAVASPITRLDAVASEAVYIQHISFLSNFSGVGRMQRGSYCWADDGIDPLAGARYEMLLTADSRMQVMRHGADGSPEALVIDEPIDFAAIAAADPEGPDSIDEATRIGLLCRPDDQGRGQIAARVEDIYFVTTDDGGLRPGGGAGLVIRGSGERASGDTIVTFDGVFVLDGSTVPFGGS